MKTNNDYLYIQAWDRMMGSAAHWTQAQVERARQDEAPADAIYYSQGNQRWCRFSELKGTSLKAEIQGYVNQLRSA